MGNLVNPISMRLNSNIYWNSQWVSFQNNKYSFLLSSDYLIYSYINWFCSRNYFNKYGWIIFLSHFKIVRLQKNILILFFFKDYKFYKFIKEYWDYIIKILKRKKYRKFVFKKSKIKLYLNAKKLKTMVYIYSLYSYFFFNKYYSILDKSSKLTKKYIFNFYLTFFYNNKYLENLLLFISIYLHCYFFLIYKKNNNINILLKNKLLFLYLLFYVKNFFKINKISYKSNIKIFNHKYSNTIFNKIYLNNNVNYKIINNFIFFKFKLINYLCSNTVFTKYSQLLNSINRKNCKRIKNLPKRINKNIFELNFNKNGSYFFYLKHKNKNKNFKKIIWFNFYNVYNKYFKLKSKIKFFLKYLIFFKKKIKVKPLPKITQLLPIFDLVKIKKVWYNLNYFNSIRFLYLKKKKKLKKKKN